MNKLLILITLILLSFSACSSKKVEKNIDYETQQKNSKEALKTL